MNTKEPKAKTTQTVNTNDTSIIVTREYLISLLRAWQQNKITTARFYETIEILHASDTEFLDWENDGELVSWECVTSESVTSEIIAYFEMLDLDFITQEAIEPAIKFLNIPIGTYNENINEWYQFEHSLNIEDRIEKLKGQYPYIDPYKKYEGPTVTYMNYDIIVTREYLISLLEAWKQNKITVKEIYETANYLYHNGEAIDLENGNDYSVTIKVLQYLESLNINFITQEDIEPIIEFLNTPIGKIEEGIKKLEKYKSSINHQERIKKLNGQYPYIRV